MSVYKQFQSSDYVITPFQVNKSFTFKGTSEFTASNVSIDRFIGKNITTIPFVSGSNPTGQIQILNQELIYKSIKQIYYGNYQTSPYSGIATTASVQLGSDPTGDTLFGPISSQGKYFNYFDKITTLTIPRLFPTASGDSIGVISIPSNLFGENIKPGTLTITTPNNTLIDDGEGNLMEATAKVGDIVYQHGIIILTAFGSSITGSAYGSSTYGTSIYGTNGISDLNEIITGSNITCSFQSTTTIYESQYKCTLRENEFNYTQNPSSMTSSLNNNILYDTLTGSYFEPYITTVGLYNENYELIAVGKLSQPLQSSNTTDTNILINLDL
jgi:hypothetical protein